MIYTLVYKSEPSLKNHFTKIRSSINPVKDCIHLTLAPNQDREEMYKLLLKLEGGFRKENNDWISPSVKMRVIK